MKNLLKQFTVVALLCCFSFTASAQSKEEGAIKELLYNDTKLWLEGDYEAWSSLFVKEPRFYVTLASKGGAVYKKGWESYQEIIKPSLEQNVKSENRFFSQENVTVHVDRKIAWAHYDITVGKAPENWSGPVHAILEKVNKTWKIVSINVMNISSWEKKEANN